jgi:uncharacterized RDD family membrane protein YckC
LHTGSADRGAQLPHELCVAPVWRRVVAGLINASLGIAWVVGIVFAGYRLRAFLGPPLRPLTRRLEERGLAGRKGGLSLRVRALFLVSGLTFELDGRNRRSLGARVMRIRRVDMSSGGPVSVRGALIRHFAKTAIGAGLGGLIRPMTKRATDRMQALQPQLKELQQAHTDDKTAQQQALTRFYREHKVNPLRSCGAPVLPLLAPSLAVLFSPRRQNFLDRLAGIIWVMEDRS